MTDLERRGDLLFRCLPSLGGHARGFAQEVLALVCYEIGANPFDWTSHEDTLRKRIEILIDQGELPAEALSFKPSWKVER